MPTHYYWGDVNKTIIAQYTEGDAAPNAIHPSKYFGISTARSGIPIEVTEPKPMCELLKLTIQLDIDRYEAEYPPMQQEVKDKYVAEREWAIEQMDSVLTEGKLPSAELYSYQASPVDINGEPIPPTVMRSAFSGSSTVSFRPRPTKLTADE